jgi:gamma-glutamyltranspeptidase/glutathione hydrolase
MRVIGDPDFVHTDVAALMEKVRLLDRRAHIAMDRTRPAPKFFLEEHGTTHFIIVDNEENIVSMTTTVNDAFGAKVSTATSGVILNNELDDFSTKATATLVATGARASASEVPEESTGVEGPNEPRPFARPTSSMTPTIVFRDGRPTVVVGGSGGLRIATGVTQALLARLVFHQSAADCVSAARLHTPVDEVPAGEPIIELDDGVAESVVQDLRARGEAVRLGPNYSAVQMVAFERGEHGAVHISAAADPRKGGVALVE